VTLDRAIAVETHGRYLVEVPAGGGRWPLLIGFHGYAEAAEHQLARLRSSAPAGGWLVVAVQGLHRFYRGRREEVVANWMTRQDRELAIADNLAYVAAVIDAVSREWTTDGRVVFAGFSQGVAMAFRAAAHRGAPVVAFGGDVPPELDSAALAKIPSVLIGRGTRDDWYGRDTNEADVRRLQAAGTEVESRAFDAGHEWTEEVSRAAADFLSRRR
jgi:predicted esterase